MQSYANLASSPRKSVPSSTAIPNIAGRSRLFSGLEQASLYALHHHESANGTGYPAGLKGADIPLVSRIISVIDSYDAMVSNRCYRPGLPHREAISRLLQSSGTQFDPEVVRIFIPIAEKDTAEVFAAAGTSMAAVL